MCWECWSRSNSRPNIFPPLVRLAVWRKHSTVQYLGSNILASDTAFEFAKVVVATAYWFPRFLISWPDKKPALHSAQLRGGVKFKNKSKIFLYFLSVWTRLRFPENRSAQLSMPTCLSCPARQWWRATVAFQPPKTTARGAGVAAGRRRRLRPAPWRAAGPPVFRDWAAPTRSLAQQNPPRWCSHYSPDARAGQTLFNSDNF